MNGQMRVNRVIQKNVLLENRVSGGLPVVPKALPETCRVGLTAKKDQINGISSAFVLVEGLEIQFIWSIFSRNCRGCSIIDGPHNSLTRNE